MLLLKKKKKKKKKEERKQTTKRDREHARSAAQSWLFLVLSVCV